MSQPEIAHTPSTSTSTSNFQLVFNAALERYENKTKNKLLTHPLAAQLQSCDSPTAIASMLQGLVQQFDQNRSTDQRLTSWLNPTVNVLYAFSATVGEGIGLVFSPANVIFAGIGVLLLVSIGFDLLVDAIVTTVSLRRQRMSKRAKMCSLTCSNGSKISSDASSRT
ncbi:hypothetical protein BC826DRAFT_665273 [Russula brevipes]|nr:hypothetical protein BC826DRAFT_665273 [Russula brevipes]